MSNQFKAFATSGGANALTPTAWAALTSLLANGFQSGVAKSEEVNTALRQAAAIANLIGNFINDQGFDALDDSNAANLLIALNNALRSYTSASKPTPTVYATAGSFSYAVPANVKRIRVRVWGGGGGGGGASAAGGSGAGGGGGYAEGIYTVAPGATLTVLVGAAGTSGTGSSNGGAGGTSSVTGACSASGGQGGAGNSGTGSVAGGNGGSGTGGEINVSGTNGQPSIIFGTNYVGGGSGAAFGSVGTYFAASIGGPGSQPGSGGSGASNSNSGGAGAPGMVVIEPF